MNSFNERLDEILTKLENAVEHSTMRRVANRQDVSNRAIHSKAKDAIRTLVREEIIGEDEKLTGTLDENNFYVDSNEQHLDTVKVTRNTVRAEQRKKLGDE